MPIGCCRAGNGTRGRLRDFAPTPGTPHDMELDARARALLARPEVRAAIDKVGRVASYPLEAPWGRLLGP